MTQPMTDGPPGFLPTGSRLRLEYADHNEAFAAQLPREATVVRRVLSTGGMNDWFLVRLDRDVTWVESRYGHLLLRSRWLDHPLGGPLKTSVFILLVPDAERLGPDPVDIHRFEHVAWGMTTTLD